MQNSSPAFLQYINNQGAIKAQSIPVANSGVKVNLTQKPDIFVNTNSTNETINKTKTKKILKGIAIGTGIAAVVVGGVFLAKKISANKVKQLAETIDFKNADNIDDAIKFGKEHLGIKKYKGFTSSDLDVLNWVNEGLVDVNNATGGKAVMPKIVSYVDDISTVGIKEGQCVAGGMSGNGNLVISKTSITDYKNALINLFKTHVNEEILPLALEKIDKSKNFSEIEKSLIKICKTTNTDLNKILGTSFTCPKQLVYHEIGHLQHSNNIAPELFEGLKKEAEIKVNKTVVTPEAQELRNLFQSKINVAKGISNYATESPCEFVAECYPRLVYEKLTGKKVLSDEALELYKQFGGAII